MRTRAGYDPRLVVWRVTEWNLIVLGLRRYQTPSAEARTLPWDNLYAFCAGHAAGPGSLARQRPYMWQLEERWQVEEQKFWPISPTCRQMPEGSQTKQASRRPSELAGRGHRFVVLYVPRMRMLLPTQFRAGPRDRLCREALRTAKRCCPHDGRVLRRLGYP